MQGIFALILLIIMMVVSYRLGKRKGYSGGLFAFLTTLCPIMPIIALVLPDKSQDRVEAAAQQRRMEDMSRRIRELEQKAAEKPAEQPKSAQDPVQPDVKVRPEEDRDSQMSYIEGVQIYNKKMYLVALAHFRPLAEKGHLNAQMYCAQIYRYGQGVDVNYEKALYWYERAAEQGMLTAQMNCAAMYANGDGCTPDQRKSHYWYEKAAEQGDDDAQLRTGMMYELGRGTEVDTKKARYWYEKAATQGNANAQKLLSNMRD